jgi:predicted lipid-binding transport protein (Tim44 family)
MLILCASISAINLRFTAIQRRKTMSLHILPQSILTLGKARSPLARAPSNVNRAAAKPLTGADDSSDQAAPAQPFSCMSSGRAKARDVAAARRYYVDSV